VGAALVDEYQVAGAEGSPNSILQAHLKSSSLSAVFTYPFYGCVPCA
jgi:hypothetical protein